MSTFTVTVDDKAVQQALATLAGKAADLSPAMRAIARALRNITEDAFGKQASPFGAVWKALNKSTLKARRGGGAGAQILQDTGQLAASITATSDATSATLTAGKKYAAIHQFGGTIQRPAYSKQVRHRTDRKGALLRASAGFGGKGLIFARDSHKNALTRFFEVKGYSVTIPARPFLPIDKSGNLAPVARDQVVRILQNHLLGGK